MLNTEIHINTPRIQRRYHVLVNGNTIMGGVTNKTKVETEWLLTILDVDNDKNAKIELIMLDSNIIETENEAFRELSIIANQLKKVTQDIVCIIDRQGNIRKIVNTEQISKKWEQLKREMISLCGRTGELEDFFNVNEKLFNDQGILKQYVEQLEFFKLYFNGLYGRTLKDGEVRETDNAFKTNKITYNLVFDHDEDKELIRIRFRGNDFMINHKWLEKAYGQFPFIDMRNIEPNFDIRGDYLIEKATGLIKNARFVWDENVSKELRLYTEYVITEKRLEEY